MSGLSFFITQHPVWFVILCLIFCGILLLAYLIHYGFSGQPAQEDQSRPLPGDEILGNEPNRMRGCFGINIHAPREKVWPYLAQLGLRRAGFYSFDFLERLLGFHIYNTYTIVDEWQNITPGEYLFYHQGGIGSEITRVKPNDYFTTVSDSRCPSKCQGAIAFIPPFKLKFFAWTWNFYLFDDSDHSSRLFCRCDVCFSPFTGFRKGLVAVVLGIPSYVMGKKMLKTIKACAEGRKS